MAVYRYLPIPSDRMGFLWAVTNIPGIEVLEFGPMGTTNFATRHMEEAPIYSTHISDAVLTFGDSRPLKKALKELEERRAPQMIYVMQSAVTSIIGFDMEAFCEEWQPEMKARLIPVTFSGLGRDLTDGMAFGMQSLLKEQMEIGTGKRIEKKPVFHILGAVIDDIRIRPDVEELCRMMQGAFGLKEGLVLPCGATLQSLRNAAAGQISLVLRREALPAAEYLKQKAGIPYVEGAPYGVEGTRDWLEKVGEVLGQAPSEEWMESELSALSSIQKPDISSACIVSGSSMAEDLASFLKREWKVGRLQAFAFEKTQKARVGSWSVPYREKALDRFIQEEKPELLIGNSVVTERDFGYHACRLSVKKPCGIPNQDLPPEKGYMGFRGYQNLAEEIAESMKEEDKIV